MATETEVQKVVISGWAFHCHHNKLYEWVYNYEERVTFIRENKPLEEQELRLRLFKMIPEELVLLELIEAGAAYGKAGAAYGKAWAAYGKAEAAYEPYFIDLHQELCPNCPWDGETIFSRKE